MNLTEPVDRPIGKISQLILLLLFVVAFPGCQTGSGERSVPNSTSSTSDSSDPKKGRDTPQLKGKVLVFRNVRSWNRKVDFEEVLSELGVPFEVKPDAEIAETNL